MSWYGTKEDLIEAAPFLPFSMLMDWSLEVDEKWHFLTLPVYMILAIPAIVFGVLVIGPIWMLAHLTYWAVSFPYNVYKLFKR